MNKRAVIDTINRKLCLCGPRNTEIKAPPGTEVFQLEQTPSGHLVLPVSDFEAARRSTNQRTKLDTPQRAVHFPVAEGLQDPPGDTLSLED